MPTDAESNLGAGAIRTQVDEAALASWLEAHVAGFRGPLTIDQFNGGQSNPTYRLTTPTARYVLRRKPPGPILKGAHDVLREARVLSALEPTEVPVPRVLGTCSDTSVLGSDFFVMEMVDGRIFWDTSFTEIPQAERSAYFDAMNRVIAAMHSLDPEAIGLGDYGRVGNYFERQIGRWSKQYFDDALAGRDPDMDAVVAWRLSLRQHDFPPDRTAHIGGARLGIVDAGPSTGRFCLSRDDVPHAAQYRCRVGRR